MPTTIFRPTSSINQNRPKMKISNLCVFCPIWIKFGIWANNRPRITWYKFEMATATSYASIETPHIPSRTIILFRFFSCNQISFTACLFFIQEVLVSSCSVDWLYLKEQVVLIFGAYYLNQNDYITLIYVTVHKIIVTFHLFVQRTSEQGCIPSICRS